MQLTHLTFVDCYDSDAGEAKPLVEAGNVLLIAGQSIQCLRQHDIKPSTLGVAHQLLDSRPQERSARNRAV